MLARNVRPRLLGIVAVALLAIACSESANPGTAPHRPSFWAVEPPQCFRLTGAGRIDKPEPPTATRQSKNKSQDYATFGFQARPTDGGTMGSGQIEWIEHDKQALFQGFTFYGQVESFTTVDNHYADQQGQPDPVCGQFSGTGQVRGRDGTWLSDKEFTVEHACDEGERGVGHDHIRMIIERIQYDRAGILTGGNIAKHTVKDENACAPGPTTGDLIVGNTTTPTDLMFSYTVTVDQATTNPVSQAMPTNQSVTFQGLAAGDHTVDLSDLAANCTVTPPGTTSQTVTVPAGGTVNTTFQVDCTGGPTTADLTVTNTTSGCDAIGVSCPTDYTVTVDGTLPGSMMPLNGSVVFPGLTIGDHAVVLSGQDPNCTVTSIGGTSPTVTVSAGGTTFNFVLECSGVT